MHEQTIEQLVEDREQLDQQLRQLQISRPSNYFPAPGRGGLRQSQSLNRPNRGYNNVGDRGATANGPSQNSDPHSDDESSQEEESAFSREEDNDEDEEENREDEEEEEKAIDAPITVSTQGNAARGRFRGRGGQRGRFRGRGYRNTGNSNQRFPNYGRGNYRGPRGQNPRQSYPSSNNTRSNQSDRRVEREQDTTDEPSLVDNHDEQVEQEFSGSVSVPKDQRPPRERRTVPQDASNTSPTNELQQEDSPPGTDQPISVDEAD